MIDDDPPAKLHSSLCGANTERSHTYEDECEQLSYGPSQSNIHHKNMHKLIDMGFAAQNPEVSDSR